MGPWAVTGAAGLARSGRGRVTGAAPFGPTVARGVTGAAGFRGAGAGHVTGAAGLTRSGATEVTGAAPLGPSGAGQVTGAAGLAPVGVWAVDERAMATAYGGTSATTRKTLSRLRARAQRLAQAFRQNAALIPMANVAGQRLTQAQVVAKLDAALQLWRDVEAAEQEARVRRLKLIAAAPALLDFTTNLTQAVVAHFGPKNPINPDFGAPKPTRRKLTPEEHAVAAALGRQTRAVRGTLGPKQRLAITRTPAPTVVVLDAKGRALPGPKKKR
ncbi:MAG: hypothetical protein ACYCWW_14330 [Deltaproteobacteria bacterium]